MGRFAPKGGGTKGKGGKMGKSAKNLKARATYKAAASKLRKKQSGIGINTSKGSAGHRKQIGGAKSGLTRVTNKLTKKRAAAGSGIKKNFADQTKASRAKKFRSKTTKGRAAKAEWKKARGEDRYQGLGRKSGKGMDSNQKRVIKKQTGKTAYSQGFRETPKFTKAPRAGSKTKAQKIRAKIKSKKFENKELRGSEFKGVKKRPATKKAAAAKKVTAAKKAQQSAKQRYKKAKTAAKTAERFSQIDRGTKEARKGAAAKGRFTKLKKSMSKGATKGKGYGLSKKGQEAKKRFTELKRERGGATKGKGTAAQKRAGIGYRKTQAALGKKTKGRTPKGRLPGGESLKQQMKAAPKQSFRGKGSKAKRRAAEIKLTASKSKRGSAATKRDRILRTAKRNLIRGGPSGPSAARRRKRMQMAEDIMTKAMGGSTAWKNFGPRF